MTLPYDYARCAGAGSVEDGVMNWREGCDDCLRRTSPGSPHRQSWMTPDPIIAFECPWLIEPGEYYGNKPR
jgi:hypothetical protein